MRRTLVPLAILAVAGGCSNEPKPMSMAATPESSRAALAAALDGWKAGRTYDDLAGQSPPVYLMDDDLRRGARLLDYQVEGDGQPRGTGYSYVVTLTLQDKDGAKPPAKRKVAYTAVSDPKRAVTREDRNP